MKIIIYSSTFLPNIGGLENIMAGLADAWTLEAHEVDVYTKTPADLSTDNLYKYNVFRNSDFWSLFKAAKKTDVFVEANISLKTCLIGLLFFKKWVVIHHLPYSHEKSIPAVLKNMLTRVSKNIAVSKYISNTLYGKSKVIYNFYNPLYRNLFLPRTDFSLLFVGRLVTDKGAMLLLNAILPIFKIHPSLHLTIAGNGDEKNNLVDFVKQNKLQNKVTFCGSLPPEKLCLLYNQHKIVVIPSIWEEPFGIVALEALACGCEVVYAAGGGLSEAVDENGISFQRGDASSLQAALLKALHQSGNTELFKADSSKHLKLFSIDYIASSYLTYFKTLCR